MTRRRRCVGGRNSGACWGGASGAPFHPAGLPSRPHACLLHFPGPSHALTQACPCPQAVEPSTLVPLAHGGAKQVYLVGDPVQLPATVMSQRALAQGYSESLFKRLQTAGYPVHMLDTQVGGWAGGAGAQELCGCQCAVQTRAFCCARMVHPPSASGVKRGLHPPAVRHACTLPSADLDPPRAVPASHSFLVCFPMRCFAVPHAPRHPRVPVHQLLRRQPQGGWGGGAPGGVG